MRIVVADHQSSVRFAVRTLLRLRPGMEVVGEASCAEDLLARVRDVQPDLVLMHWRLSGGPSVDLVRELRQVGPGMRVIALSAKPEARQESLDAGVDAFVCKMDPPESLLAAIGSTCPLCGPAAGSVPGLPPAGILRGALMGGTGKPH